MNPTHFTFKFTFEATQHVLNGIAKLPFEVAQPILVDLKTQIDAQMPKAQEPPAPVAVPRQRGRKPGSKNRPRPEIVPADAPVAQQA